VPNSREVLEPIEHVTAMIEADARNPRNAASVLELLILKRMMKTPNGTTVELERSLRRYAHLAADGE
jgi:hypothetical protein